MDPKDPKKYNKDSKFKGWFLTWPRCAMKKEDALTVLKTNGLPDIVEYVICEEEHEDGSPHLHAFVKLAKKIRFSQAAFDLLSHHGHYEPAKSWAAVKRYVTKEDNYISNIDIDAAVKKKSKGVKEKNALMLAKTPKELVDDGDISLLMLPQLLKAKRAYDRAAKPPKHIPRKCYWIWGPPRAGKSYVVREMFDDIYEKPQSKWWDGYAGEDVVLLDDMDKHGECLGHLLKIWADNYRFLAETKGDNIYPTYTKFIITSNYQIGDIFGDKEIREAVMCRFVVINLINRDGQSVVEKIIKN